MEMDNPSAAKIKQFTALYVEHKFNATQACVAMGMTLSRARKNSWIYKAKAEIEVGKVLKQLGYDQADVGKNFIRWANGRSGDLSIRANRELAKIFGMYPEPPPAQQGDIITVIWNVRTEPKHPRERTLTVAANQTDAT